VTSRLHLIHTVTHVYFISNGKYCVKLVFQLMAFTLNILDETVFNFLDNTLTLLKQYVF